MENELLKAYAEVDAILSYMQDTYVQKIPEKLRKLFKNEKLQGYVPSINPKMSLDKQNLQKRTLAILAMLNLNYWCEDGNTKKELLEIYAENDKKREKKLREKYNPENLFKEKKIIKTEKREDVSVTEYKESNFIKKILNKIISFFNKR